LKGSKPLLEPEQEQELPAVMLVIGGSGFLGSHLVETILTKEWDARVRIFDIAPPKLATHPRVEYVKGDISSYQSLLAASEGVHTIFHVVALGPGKSAEQYHQVNVLGMQNIIKLAQQVESVSQVIFTSTVSVVFNGQDIEKGKETLAYSTFDEAYVQSNISAEKLLLGFRCTRVDNSTVRSCILRISNMFGPRDTSAWPNIIESATKGKRTYVIGKCSVLVDWTYVENAADALCLAAEQLAVTDSRASSQVFNITNGEPMAKESMRDLVCESLGLSKIRVTKIPIPLGIILPLIWLFGLLLTLLRPIKHFSNPWNFRVRQATKNQTFDISKAKEILGYSPQISVAEGVVKTKEYFELSRKAL